MQQSARSLLGDDVRLSIGDLGLTMPYGYESGNIVGMLSPAKTPAAAITRLNQELTPVFARSDSKQKMLDFGIDPVTTSPEEFGAIIKKDIEQLSKIIHDAGIKLD